MIRFYISFSIHPPMDTVARPPSLFRIFITPFPLIPSLQDFYHGLFSCYTCIKRAYIAMKWTRYLALQLCLISCLLRKKNRCSHHIFCISPRFFDISIDLHSAHSYISNRPIRKAVRRLDVKLLCIHSPLSSLSPIITSCTPLLPFYLT
jgi:hypothetical protein